MAVCFALWCPQGRDRLPLAAQLLLAQIPAAQVAWSSDEPAPPSPAAGTTADVWLVVASAELPDVPEWRVTTSGRWWVFPGTTSNWTSRTATQLDAWRADEVLVDLLPEELNGGAWLAQWSRWPLRWLPAFTSPGAAAKSRAPLLIAVDATFPATWIEAYLTPLADAFGGQVTILSEGKRVSQVIGLAGRADTLLVCSEDPVLQGIAAHSAVKHGTAFFSWGKPAAWWRVGLSAATVQWTWKTDLPEADMVRNLRAIVRALATAKRPKPADVPAPSWADWLATVVERPENVKRSEAAAQLLPALSQLRSYPDFAELERRWQQTIPEWNVEGLLFARLPGPVLDPLRDTLLDRLLYLPAGSAAGRLWQLIVRIAPEWLALARERCATWGAQVLAGNLFTFAADEHLLGDRGELVKASAVLFERALQANANDSILQVCCAITAALSGDLGRADAVIAVLQQSDRTRILPFLAKTVRAWTTLIDAGERGRLPAGAQAWWQRHADALAETNPAYWLQAGQGALWWGDFAGAEARFARANLTPAVWAGMSVLAFLRGASELASRLTAKAGPMPASATGGERFTFLCSEVLVGGRSGTVTDEFVRLDRELPNYFAPTVPSNPRCLYRALVYRRIGDTESAQHWWDRFAAEDPTAESRRALFNQVKALALA